TPRPSKATLPLHKPTPTSTTALARIRSDPPSASTIAAYPTPPNRHSTGNRGLSVSPSAPSLTFHRYGYQIVPSSSVSLYHALPLMLCTCSGVDGKGLCSMNDAVDVKRCMVAWPRKRG